MNGFKTVLFAFILFSLAFLPQYPEVLADRGGFSPLGYNVFEGGQKAIAAWNGTDEILILSTDVHGSQETHVIEIMPLPAEPKIEKGSEDSFRQIQSLVRQFYEFYGGFSGGTLGGYEGGIREKGVEIIFHDEIGAHSITVVVADVTEELTSWIEDFLLSMEIDYGEFPADLGDLIAQYIEDEINFFVLDVIAVNSTVKSVEPLVYRFKTSSLYYPLIISSLFSGDTEISLCTLTSGALDDASVLKEGFERVVRFRVKLEALSEIDSVMPKLFTNSPYLCFYKYSGSLNSFENDIKIGFVPFFNFAPFFRVHPILAALTIALGAALILLFILAPKRKSMLDTIIDLSGGTIIFVAVFLSIDFLIIWWLNLSTGVNLDLLTDVYVWRNFLMFESVIMMILGGAMMLGVAMKLDRAGHWSRGRPYPISPASGTSAYKSKVLPRSWYHWSWFSLTAAGFVLFILFIYLSS
jgi:hypothetical protein